MELIYFLVTSLEAYADKFGFHANYFVEKGAFLEGLLYSAGIGALIALLFYFGCCNGESVKPATRVNWLIGLFLVGLIAFFISDLFIIGSEGEGFYASLDAIVREYCVNNSWDTLGIQERQIEMNTIVKNLKEGKDVALEVNLTNVFISMLVYFLISLGVKNYTKHGSQIPF